MAGTLFIVATPIGNLEDVTLRALRVLREADVIAAEDTRHTATLLRHYDIRTPTTSFHEHNEREKLPVLIRRLEAGERIALVADAGTPSISDPGYRLVRAAHEAGIRVEPIPGASAVLAALSASGLPTDSFRFVGFPPIRGNARKCWFEGVANATMTTVFFESPHRLGQTLEELQSFVGPDRELAVARELTKVHESLVKRPISTVVEALPKPLRGEFTVVVSPSSGEPIPNVKPEPTTLLVEFGEMTCNGRISRREAIRRLAQKHRISSKQVYAAIENAKLSVE